MPETKNTPDGINSRWNIVEETIGVLEDIAIETPKMQHEGKKKTQNVNKGSVTS